MRLDFNVLWIEDQKANVEPQCKRIELLIRKEGFRLQVKFAASIDEAKNFLSNDIYGDHIDLVLMDYDLGAGDKGDKGLVEVRNKFHFKDIVFYSSQASDLPQLVANQKVQGVFCSTRDELPDTVDGVFEALVKKVLDIDHARGIVMGATSDIDHYVNECLTTSFEKSDEARQKKALAIVTKRLKEIEDNFQEKLDEIKKISHVSELQEFHNIYTSNDRLRLLKNILKDYGSSHQEATKAISGYITDTVPIRNRLAHVRVETNGFSRKLFDKNNNELTSDQMKSLRQKLLEFQELFESLSEQLYSSARQDESL